MTPSEEILNRYKQIERKADAFGRVIGVKRLRLSQQMKIEEMAPTEGKNAIPLLVAAVVEIDGLPIPFPRSRGELDAMLDRLDSEGLAAAAEGWRALMGMDDATDKAADADGEKPEPESEIEVAKK